MATWYVSLHTADPVGGDQTTSEVVYNGYARVGLDDWGVVDGGLANNADIVFPTNKSSVVDVTHVVVGTDATGVGSILYSGALSATTQIYRRSRPTFAIGSLIVEAEAPGDVVSATLSVSRRPRWFVAYDEEQKWQGRCVATAHFANVSASATLIRKASPAPLPAFVHVISKANLYAHHAEVYGLVLHDNTERLNRQEEDEVIALLLMAA